MYLELEFFLNSANYATMHTEQLVCEKKVKES